MSYRSLALSDNFDREDGQLSLHIRAAERTDMATVISFVRSTAHWYEKFLHPNDMTEHNVDEVWAERNFKLRDFFVGFFGDAPVGTISIQYFEKYAYLGYIYLDRNYVGQGFGHQLMNHARQIIVEKQTVKGLSLIAHPKAAWAKKAYLKFGFKIAERDKDRILAWERGALVPHYEEGFELYIYELTP